MKNQTLQPQNPQKSQNFQTNLPTRPGYEHLVVFVLGKVIQDLTAEFCDRWVSKDSRTHDQMIQAARSNPQNLAEGYTAESLKGYIYLAGIAHGSNEELANDYQDFLRQKKLTIWPKDHPKIREFRGFRARWSSQTTLNTPQLPQTPEEAANMLLTFCQMESYLLEKLVESLKNKHEKEGGLTENLYRKRIAFRNSNPNSQTPQTPQSTPQNSPESPNSPINLPTPKHPKLPKKPKIFALLLSLSLTLFLFAGRAHAADVYYSVGQDGTTDRKTGSPTIIISSGAATFSVAQTGNIGVGDRVAYNGSTTIAYISGKTDSDQKHWTLVTATGGTPADVSGQTVNSIKREFSSLSLGVAGSYNSSHLNTQNLINGNYILHLPCYYDGGAVDSSAVTISGWTTDSTHYLDIYTPSNTSTEANQSQHHSGKWTSTAWSLEGTGNPLIDVSALIYVRIHGLQISRTNTAGNGIRITDPPSPYGYVYTMIYDNIVRSTASGSASGILISYSMSTYYEGSVIVYNNVVYGFSAGNGIRKNGAQCNYTAGGCTCWSASYIYNNTVYNNQAGVSAGTSGVCAPAVINNNLAQSCVSNCYSGTSNFSYHSNNLSEDATSPDTSYRGKVVLFADEDNLDLHLFPSDTSARNAGANLSSNFTTDIDGQTRPATWDIGADEVAGPLTKEPAFRWFANANSTDVGSDLAAQDTATAAMPRGDPFRLRSLLHNWSDDTLATSGGQFKLQYSERSSVDNTCDPPFGDSGTGVAVSNINGSSGNISVNDIALDSQSQYLYSAGFGGSGWRIEKRKALTSALCSAAECGIQFGTNGVVTSGNGIPYAIAIDSNYMYVAGYYTPSSANWRIEKRRLDTGALCTTANCPGQAFGAGGTGYVNEDVNPGQHSYITDLAIDGNFMYLAGSYTTSSDEDWRIEKRNLSDGTLVWSQYYDSGVSDQYPKIAIDSEYMYLWGTAGVSGHALQQRNLSNGVEKPGTGIYLSGAYNQADHDIVYSGGYIYISRGTIITPSIEKRLVSNLSFVSWQVSQSSTPGCLAIDSTGIYGIDRNTRSYLKRDLVSGSLCDNNPSDECGGKGTFGTGGEVSAVLDSYALAADGNYLFAAGQYSFSLGGTVYDWRTEKFLGSSGALATGGLGENYQDVTANTPIAYYDNSSVNDGDDLTANAKDPDDGLVSPWRHAGGDDPYEQDYEESNNFTNSVTAIPSQKDGEWDFALYNRAASHHSAYCFRIVNADGSLLSDYEILPEILPEISTPTDFEMENALQFRGHFKFQ